MPDAVQKIGKEGTEYKERIEGPTFEDWKAQYLSEHGGTTTDIRDKHEPDDNYSRTAGSQG